MNLRKLNVPYNGHCKSCGALHLDWLFTCAQIPAFLGVTKDYEHQYNDKFVNINWLQCCECGLIQTDYSPGNDVYEVLHSHAVGGTWELHRQEFLKFINKRKFHSVLEVGPSCNPIARGVESYYSYYIDLMDCPFQTRKNEFYCKEDFLWGSLHTCAGSTMALGMPKFDIIIASHVFEHMNDPIRFINKCNRLLSPNGPRTVYLSIPDFESWFDNGYANAISPEHVIYPCKNFFKRIGKNYNVRIRMEEFKGHSLFIEIDFSKPYEEVYYGYGFHSPINEWFDDFTKYVLETEIKINRLSTDSCAIFGASHLSQYMLCMNKVVREKVKFVWDNSVSKHNLRLYGTGKFVKDKVHLEEVSHVIVPPSPYRCEIIKQLEGYNVI
jgi:SAM-dependent methyltransferase